MKILKDFFNQKVQHFFSPAKTSKAYAGGPDFYNFEKLIALSELYSSGQVYLLSLQYLKDELGSKWDGLRETILDTLTKKMKKITSEQDVFVSRSEAEHLIVFSDRSYIEAQQKCGDILRELSITYLGTSYDHNVALRIAIGRRNGKLLFKDVAYSSKTAAEINIYNQSDIIDPPELESFTSPIKAKKARPYELIYKPIWDKKNNIVSTFMVSIRKNNDGKLDQSGTGPIGYNALENPFCLASMIELDQFMLGEIVAMMQDFFQNNFRAMFSIPLHYNTLFNLTRLHNFLFQCQSIPAPLRKYINFSLSGFPEGFPEARMHEITTSLLKFCRDVTIICDTIPQDVSYYKGLSINGICLNIKEKEKKNSQYISNIKKFARDCARENINLSLDGIDDIEELKTMRETDLNFISGNSIGRYSDTPKHMKYMEWHDIVKH